MTLQVLIAMIAGWINRHKQQVIAYLLEENSTLHATLGGRRSRFTDAERRRLAATDFFTVEVADAVIKTEPGGFLFHKSGRGYHASVYTERSYIFQSLRVNQLFQNYRVNRLKSKQEAPPPAAAGRRIRADVSWLAARR